jgi:hypothetical protein
METALMSTRAKQEYVQAIYQRYRRAPRPEKGRILDEFCAGTRYHRKAAIRVLNGPAPGAARPSRRRALTYPPAVITALRQIWSAAGYPWSVRLKALLPLWLPWARRRLHLRSAVERQLLAISARQIDRRLAPERRQLTRRLYGRTKPGTLLKHHIPLKTDRWDVAQPGFTEIDLVAHCGSLGDGEFVHSLNLTDIHTTWVETAAVLGKSQAAVQAALEELRHALPFRLRGIDSDNGSEFINQHLWDYCQAQEIQFTRGRPYKKDDNAHIEQKNWTHVRKLRVLACPDVRPGVAAQLRRQRDALDPFALARSIEQQLERIYALANPRHSTPGAPAPTAPVPRPRRQRLRIHPNPDRMPHHSVTPQMAR